MEEEKKQKAGIQENIEFVEDYMVPFSDYPRVNHNDTLEDAINIMYRMSKEKGYRWIVVQNDNGNIEGFLTLRTVFQVINKRAPQESSKLGLFGYAPYEIFFWEGVQAIKNTPLKKCIRKPVDVSVRKNDYPSKAAEVILENRITIVPVVDDDNNIVGIVRPVDLLPFIKKLFDKSPY